MKNRLLPLFVLLAACDGEPTPVTPTPVPVTPTVIPTPEPTPPPPTPTPPPEPTPVPTFDCATLTDTFVQKRVLDGPRGYHGLVIDANDDLVGATTSGTLVTADRTTRSPWLPGMGIGEQMEMMPNGDIAGLNDGNNIVMISPTGGVTPIGSNVSPYAIELGPDGYLYTTNNYWVGENAIFRVDPATGASQRIAGQFTPFQNNNPHALTFTADGTQMFISTIGDGTIYVLDFDPTTTPATPLGPPQVYATGVGGWQDAIAIDACGNLYVPDYNSRSMFKVRPDGSSLVYFGPSNPDNYPHGLIWGSGSSRWSSEALYAPLPYNSNKVIELVIGGPSQWWEGEVINADVVP